MQPGLRLRAVPLGEIPQDAQHASLQAGARPFNVLDIEITAIVQCQAYASTQVLEVGSLIQTVYQPGEGNEAPARAMYGLQVCLLYTSPSPRDATLSRMPSSA